VKTTTFSLIIPTRHRTVQLRRLLGSLRDTTRSPNELEIILVIDEDDEETLRFDDSEMLLRRVEVPPGSTMGALNMSGFQAATGHYLMLLNDDVIVRTPNWDERVLGAFRRFGDEIVLVHLNDLVFRDALCVFPFLTREFCSLMNGICPTGYIHYRIDDHIHDIFELLRLAGHDRRIFLPDVVFEHTYGGTTVGSAVYPVPDPPIHAFDTWLFHSFLEERKKVAMKAKSRIEDPLTANPSSEEGSSPKGAIPKKPGILARIWRNCLCSFADSKPAPPASLERNINFIPSRLNPLAHFLETGAYEGRKPNPMFDPLYYLSENPEVAEAGANPLAHFLEFGAWQGRRPHPKFDTVRYLQENPGLAGAGINPLAHFLEQAKPPEDASWRRGEIAT